MSDKLHEAVSIAKKLYFQDGIFPTRKIMSEQGVSKFILDKYSITKIKEMAGIEDVQVNHESLAKITNEIFKKDIYEVVNQPQRHFLSPKITKKILIIGDVHEPFSHKETKEAILEFNRKVKPDYIVQVGDLYDCYALSKFPRSQNIYTPADEERLGREMAKNFFEKLHLDNPKAIKYNLFGNHDTRGVKRVLDVLPQYENVIERHIKGLMTFDNWNLIEDHRDVLEIEGILFHHGYMGKLGDHRDAALQNFVVGHTHRGGVSYRRIKNETLWELNAGFCGDPESKVMSYTSSKVQNYTLGFGFIDEYGPRFISI